MRKFIFSTLTLILLIALGFPASSQAQEISPESESGAVVCPPAVYWVEPADCMPLGPSAYLTELAQMGLTIPPMPLPASPPDPSLADLPYRYFHLEKTTVPVYTAPDGSSSAGLTFPPGFVYVSYVNRLDTGHGIYYLLPNGGWIPGMGARVSEISRFQGLVFHQTPRNSFGWPFEYIPIKSAPGYNTPETGEWLNPFDVIQIYTTQNVDGMDWHLIGPDQWVEGRKVAQVLINTTPPEGVTTGRWIDVDLAEQTLAVYENSQLVFATVIASGLEPFWTRPGLFQIYQKKETETMRNNDPSDFYYLDNVPWTMYFDGARALHGAYWRTRFGYPQSHGCVNLSVGDAHWLFNWAHEGDWVYVHDRTGQTPTDPAVYSGGAY
jgi:lipoprotein-anchoring transpeptidase ErfK/SrfK